MADHPSLTTTTDTAEQTRLAQLTKGYHALIAATMIPEIKVVVDTAEALRHFAKQQGYGLKAQKWQKKTRLCVDAPGRRR